MVAKRVQHKQPVIQGVERVASGNAGRGYRKVPSWWRAFCMKANTRHYKLVFLYDTQVWKFSTL
jgi:hypothetical protein